ncbi:protein PELOTA 1 isoform X2 [Raphanus sativus]|uniref:Protein pelota homolog n=1 Tax=Raphanus sativus TaxID=3726 RepID=A0A9W3CJ97_RAPSA|nr:protein PELOTA 1 isoform X2 [Raphanus sativus]
MKIVRRDFVRNGPGSVKMVAEDSDDLWYAYNLISTADSVMAVTFRKVQREVPGGGRDSERVRLKLEVQVEEVDYDKDASVLRIRGKNILENEHVKIGAFHTLELDLKRPFVLRKVNLLFLIVLFCFYLAFWDSLALDTLKQASDPAASADLAVVLMQEGLGQIFLVGRSVTSSRARIETSIPRKHGPAIAGYESALKKFFENVLQAFVKHVDFSVVRCAVIASPGFTKDQFHRHLLLEAERRQLRAIIENKSRIILVHTNSGYRHSLGEVLNAPNVMNMIKDTKAAKEVKALNDFFTMLSNDPARACYGPKHVEVAHERMAVQTLLITDELFRNSDVKTRKKYVDLVESVKDSGGEAFIFSSMHVSGEQLAQLTGIAALLRFPLPDLEDIEM